MKWLSGGMVCRGNDSDEIVINSNKYLPWQETMMAARRGSAGVRAWGKPSLFVMKPESVPA